MRFIEFETVDGAEHVADITSLMLRKNNIEHRRSYYVWWSGTGIGEVTMDEYVRLKEAMRE